MSKLEDVLSKLVQLKRITERFGVELPAAEGYEGLWAKPQATERFFVIFWKKNYFNAIGSHFARVQSHLKELDF